MKTQNIGNDLRAIAGDHVTTSDFERWFYSHDILHMPRAVEGLFQTVPDAVVKPASVDQVAAVLAYCNERGIPVVARGGGSSGLFQAVPKRGGVVLDMTDMNAVVDINAHEQTVTARAGLTWFELDRQLQKHGLTLRSYPSSARSATLAGWLMTSGLGIGSLKYGNAFDFTESLEIVHADGTVKEYEVGVGLARFFETEGTLGIITRITLKVRTIPEKTAHYLLTFEGMGDLFGTAQGLTRREPVPFAMELFDSRYAAMLRESGYDTPALPPGGGMLLVTYDGMADDVATAERRLTAVARDNNGTQAEGAADHWQERYDILRIRRAVPSLVPTSVYLPLGRAPRFYQGLRRLRKRPLAVVGHVVSPAQVNLMPMMATDESHPVEYILSLHTPRNISNLAVSLGGKPGGGIGVWNAPYRSDVLGKRRLSRSRLLKRAHDPRRTLNPRMWHTPHPLFTPAVYHSGMAVVEAVDSFLPAPGKPAPLTGFEKELAACVQCGYCMSYCPTRTDFVSSTPRGRILATRELFLRRPKSEHAFAPEYVSRMFQCTACGRCGVDCSTDIKSRAMWLGVRQHLAKHGLVPDSLKDLCKLVNEHHNIAARPNEQRAAWTSRLKLPFDLVGKRTAPVVYFTGCVASFFPMVQPSARAFAGVLNAAGLDFSIVGGEEWCCGFPLAAAGDTESARLTFTHNLERMKDMGAQTVVLTCPGCYRVWKEEYEDFTGSKHGLTVLHSTELMASLMEQKKLDLRPLESTVTYHDPCDLGRNAGIFDEPRYVLGRVPGLNLVEMTYNRNYCTCCGSGGDLLASNKDMSLTIAGRKLKEIQETGATTAVTACPSCIRAIYMAKINEKAKLDVLDITEVVWKALGS